MKIERIWAMPNKWTFSINPIRNLLEEYMLPGQIWIDPFSGKFSKADIKNDLNPENKADFHMDALDFLKSRPDNSADGILFDPPYSPRQVSECYKNVGIKVGMEHTQTIFWSRCKDEISRIIKINGKVICFGWNSMGCGKTRGFEMEHILLVPHGGHKNDTIVTVERKLFKESQTKERP